MRKALARRDVLRSGAGLLGAVAVDGFAPLQARAAGRANPRGAARFAVIVEAAGGMSHVDTFDFKENAGAPADLDVRQVCNGFYLSYRLFPRLSGLLDKVSIVRSFRSHETVHFRGEYYMRAGRPLDPACVAEIPPVGSVVALELESQRCASDAFPTFVSCNLGAAALPNGFLHPRFSGLDVDVRAAAGKGEAMALLEERCPLLRDLERSIARERGCRGAETSAFRSFREDARQSLGDQRWRAAFEFAAADRARYGDNEVGGGCLLARNLIRADGGARYIHIRHSGWDHHRSIFDHAAESNHYRQCNDLDRALASLLEDLSSTPSPRDPAKTLLDETVIAVPTEFGRAPGKLNGVAGRHHHNRCYSGLFAGGGVKGGRIIGRTDAAGEQCIETGWKHEAQPRTENIVASVYSALGIDWTKEIASTPSKRVYRYVDPLGGAEPCIADEIEELFV